MTDAELVARARRGDDSAFGDLLERHRTSVFKAALAVLGSAADADDAAQEAFILAYRRLDTFRGEASFKTWLLTIAWNQAINRRRSVTRFLKRMVMLDDQPTDAATFEVASMAPGPEQSTLDVDLRRAVVLEVKRLSPKLRGTLLLAQAGEYTYEEIAAMTGTPLGTIKWRVMEARRVVRQRLKARGYEHV